MKSNNFVLLILLFTVSCTSTQLIPQGKFMHTVYFDLVEDIDQKRVVQFTDELRKLAQIEQVHGLTMGSFKDVGDGRALSQYDYVIQMHFDNQTAYTIYQNHPIHLQLKKDLGKYLAGPTATHDFITQ